MFKNRLLEYSQENSLPLPLYHTVNEGKDHLPQFKCSVTVNGAQYNSPPGFQHKKPAQNAAAEEAVKDLLKQGLLVQFEETRLPKNVLEQLALKKNVPLPTYHFTKEGYAHCPTFTATVQINGTSYAGGPAKSKKEAASKAACEAIRTIEPYYWDTLSLVKLQSESTRNNDSGHPAGECKSELKMPVDNLASNNQLLGATKSEISSEKLTVENAPVVEKRSEITNVENPCGVGQSLEKAKVEDKFEAEKSLSNSAAAEQPYNRLQQDLFLAQLGQLKDQIGDANQNTQNGSKEIEGKQQGSQEIGFTESMSKRSRRESKNAEQMSERKKTHRRKNTPKRMKSRGTA